MKREDFVEALAEVVRRHVPAERRGEVAFVALYVDPADPRGPLLVTPMPPREIAAIFRAMADNLEYGPKPSGEKAQA